MRFFTVCSNNYLAYARTLGSQLAKHHPESEFTIFLADKPLGYEVSDIGYRVVPMDRLGLVEELAMITRYNITELNTAMKPWCFRYLFSESDDLVTYLDPDVLVVSPLVELEMAIQNFDAVLTPHITRPATGLGYDTENFLRLGIYNLGFLCLRPSPDTGAFVSWWAERLETECVIDLPNGIFVDQKWADFIPAFVERTKVLRHPGYNVAYWNIHNRKLVDVDDKVVSNGEPLRFVHFSGLPSDPESPSISDQMPNVTSATHPVLARLSEHYRSALDVNGHGFYSGLAFSYFVTPGGERNEHRPHLREQDGTFLRTTDTYFLVKTFYSADDYGTFHRSNRHLLAERDRAESELLARLEKHGYFDSSNPIDQTRCRLFSDSESWPELESETGLTTNERALGHVFVQELQPSLDSRVLVQSPDERLKLLLASRLQNATCLREDTLPDDNTVDFALHSGGLSEESAYQTLAVLKEGAYYLVSSNEEIWDNLSVLKQCGFVNQVACEVWSPRFGYIGGNRFVAVCQKPFAPRPLGI